MNNIILVSHASNLNGAERCFLETLKAIKLISPTANIYCIFPSPGPLIEFCTPYIVSHMIIDLPWWVIGENKLTLKERFWHLQRIYYSVKELINYFKQVKTTLVISNSMVVLTPSFAARILSLNHIWLIHELGNEDHGYSFILGECFTKKLISMLSKIVLVNSWFVYSRYENFVKRQKLKVIYQPVEIQTHSVGVMNKNPDLVLILVGRFAPSKGQHEAIIAVHELFKRGEKIKLLLVGATDDKYSCKMKTYVSENNLNSTITIIDFTPYPNFII